jgi:hypothetical protein
MTPEPHLTVPLRQGQVAYLCQLCTAYRTFLWHQDRPDQTHTQQIRDLLRLQGQLEQAHAWARASWLVSLSPQDQYTLKSLAWRFSQGNRQCFRMPGGALAALHVLLQAFPIEEGISGEPTARRSGGEFSPQGAPEA